MFDNRPVRNLHVRPSRLRSGNVFSFFRGPDGARVQKGFIGLLHLTSHAQAVSEFQRVQNA